MRAPGARPIRRRSTTTQGSSSARSTSPVTSQKLVNSNNSTFKQRFLGSIIALLIRVVGVTLRFRVEDRAGIMGSPQQGALIWIFWHNRVFTVPYIYRKYLPDRRGAVLTSPSRDGEIIAQVMKRFGTGAVRGSSNKRPAAAVRELVAWVKGGNDIVITPDGPRGPVYELQPGVIKVAQLTAAPVFPVGVRYSKCIRLKSWDGFMIPWPFTRVDVVFGELHQVPRTRDDAAFEAERQKLESLLKQLAA